ncbi:hypothetical protein GO685_03440 [Wolbachia endosymbiont of Madathamugadia hiepei]|uniref:actin-bundling T4SS effector WalE1 family protein n=1 Tax=Wolbachia endosymbiont of Madathamugadia hiepei TaxID=1241303 RepID=UPI00158D9AAA|nr:hypothetical protein [Wolbachia endosymbiont of Madathamugadia hiepei]NUX01537.1 hypothetical protein [Wolbachia endosymbiont of Madathamugadia hiepei]
MITNHETNMVSNEKQLSIFTKTFNKLFKENKESSMFDRFSSLDAKEKMLAVTAVGVIFGALLPVVAVALPVTTAGAAVALTLFFAVKAVEYGYKGLKCSAEKTWKGAKYTAGKTKDGAVYVKDSVKRGARFVKERTKEKTSDMLEAAAGRLYRAAGNEDYLDRINDELVPNSPQKEKFQGIREDLKAIFASGEGNSELVKSILSGISSKIEEKIKAKEFTGSISMDNFVENAGLTLKWERQKKFVDDLSVGKLQGLVTRRSLPKESYFIRSIFSEHHSEIKEIIRERKTYDLLKSNSMSSLDSMGTNSTDGSPVAPPKVSESPTTSCYYSERSSPNPFGSSTPTKVQDPSLKVFQNELEQRFAKLRGSRSI